MEKNEPVSPNLLKDRFDYFKSVLNKFDKDDSGTIEFRELKEMLKSDDEVPRNIVKKVFKASDKNDDGRIDLQEFIDMVEDEKFQALFGRYVRSYVNFIVPRHKKRALYRRTRSSASVAASYHSGVAEIESLYQADTTEYEGLYEESYSLWPPPIALVLISLVEIACFLTDVYTMPNDTDYGNGASGKIFIYNPFKRQECWRFLTYMFVHIGYTHLAVNLITQIFLGIPLEMVNKHWRVLTVYFLGVIAGSLLTSISDPTSYLAGASGGVYSLITAHVATIIMNWHEMSFPGVQLFIFVVLITADLGNAIYNRYYLNIDQNIGYAAHFGGALAGLLVGIWVLKNIEPTRTEKYLWWGAFVLYIVMIAVFILLNIFWSNHFLK